MRARITAAVALLVGLGLASAGLIVYAIQYQRVAAQSASEVDQELAELGTLVNERGVNPETRRPYDSVGQMLRLFLNRNVPDDDELLVAWFDNGPRYRTANDPLVESPEFAVQVRPLVESGGSVTMDSRQGPVRLTVQPVSNGSEVGALVVVTYLEETRADLAATMRTYTIVAVLALLTITAIAWLQAGRLLRPLRTLRETADEISETDLARRLPETGNDDITALTHTFNGMLERLEEAFVGQRRFLDDVGHELKTPLTVLRGHLELLDHTDPAEVAETRALLLDEIDRMSRLVGDLILLAKSGRPDFLAPQPVSLEQLTHGLLAKARGLAADRDWQLDAVGEGVVAMDEQRVTQAVLQLADNAVKHTGDGDEVAVGSSYADGQVRVWVRDTGEGVPMSDRHRIFERFGRSVVQAGDEGFGLGLSIVRAIAEAHGGSVTVEDVEMSERPRGSRFVLTLPAEPRAAAGGGPDNAHQGDGEDTWPGS